MGKVIEIDFKKKVHPPKKNFHVREAPWDTNISSHETLEEAIDWLNKYSAGVKDLRYIVNPWGEKVYYG